MDRSPGRGWRRRLGPVPPLQVAQDLFDDRAVAEQADDFQWSRAAGTDQRVGFVHFFNQPGPRTPARARPLRAAVGTVLVHRLPSGWRSRCRCWSARGNVARIGKSSVIPDQLLPRIRDVGAQGGQEIERRKDSGRRGLGIAAGAKLTAVVDDLAGFRAIAQAFEGDRRVNRGEVYGMGNGFAAWSQAGARRPGGYQPRHSQSWRGVHRYRHRRIQ